MLLVLNGIILMLALYMHGFALLLLFLIFLYGLLALKKYRHEIECLYERKKTPFSYRVSIGVVSVLTALSFVKVLIFAVSLIHGIPQ